MLLPFAIAGNFDPVSTAYGAAFWGILAALLLLYLTYKVNRKLIYLIAPIIILWYPLVETGRWAWNPNLIPFWVTLSLIFFFKRGYLFRFLSGLSIGLSIHLHYLAVFASLGLGIVVLAETIKEKKIREFIAFSAGFILAILPFIIFDLTHPPGLFLTRILYFNNLGGASSGMSFFQNIIVALGGTFQYFTQSVILEILLILTLLSLLIADLKKKSSSLRFAFIFLVQVVGLSFVANFYTHYIIPAIPFFIVYLIYPRKGVSKILSYCILIILVISGIFSFPKQITKVTWESNIASTRYIANTIANEITNNDLKNNNIAVLQSHDPNLYGRRYRDFLLIRGTNLRAKEQYEITDHLFVISESMIDSLRKDPAYEIKFFRSGKLIKSWDVPNSPWKIYLLLRSPT